MGDPGKTSPAIELRIHGVSGTSVGSMLDVSVVHKVAGDDDAGFWHRGDPGDAEIPTVDGTVLEGYRWGGLTSGAAKVAVWVFLAPFALVNAAAAAHLPGRSKPEARKGIGPGIEGTLVRLFALSLSLTFVLTIYISTVDVIGWQCGNPLDPRHPTPFCTRHPAFSRFLFWHVFDTPARHIVVTMLGPLLVLGFVWLLARRSWHRYEVYPAGSAHGFVREDSVRTPFDDPGFWDGRERATILRRLHVAACLAGLSAMLAWVLLALHAGTATKWLAGPLVVVALLVLGGAIVVAGFTAVPRRGAAAFALLCAASALLVVTLATMWVADLRRPAPNPAGSAASRWPVELPGVAKIVTILLAVQLALVVMLWLAGQWTNRHSPARTHKVGLKGCASVSLCLIALVLAGAFSAGTIMRVADWFGSPRPGTEIAARTLGRVVTPDAFTWMARGAVGALAVGVVWALVVGVVQYRVAASLADTYYSPLTSVFPDPASAAVRDAAGQSRAKKVRRTIALAQLTDRAGLILGPAVVAAFGFAATATVFAFSADSNHGWAFLTDPRGSAWRTWSASTGAWLIVGFAGVLVALVLASSRSQSRRRQVGILWDVTSFWPRSAHPLAPPCYAERTVPEYAARATFHRYGPLRFDPETETAEDARRTAALLHRKVVLSAHSQGSVIAAAAVLQLRDTTGIGLVTYGCPLDRLYARYFPSYFGGPTLEILLARLTTGGMPNGDVAPGLESRWRNLYRETDPIGARAFPPPESGGALDRGGHVDVFVDIPSKIAPGDTVFPPIEGHSDYPLEPLYSTSVVTVRDLP